MAAMTQEAGNKPPSMSLSYFSAQSATLNCDLRLYAIVPS